MTTSVSILNHGPGTVLVDVVGIVDESGGHKHERLESTREVAPNGVSATLLVYQHQRINVREALPE